MAYMSQENNNPDPDFIKLMNMMNDELDFVKNLGSYDRIVYFILIQGDLYRLFAMDSNYHKLYRLIILDQFHLPVDKYDTQRLDSCFHAMLRLEGLLDDLVNKFTFSYYDDSALQHLTKETWRLNL
ncbi:hypothetical protein BD770DRAFT_473060 [Pilaira anomala]|nr:hypothetical protein BD770DRAFT_473060 [Pilaira anomala]